MENNYKCVLSTRVAKDAQHIFSEMVQDWLDTNYLNYDLSDCDDGNMHIVFFTSEDILMFEIIGLPEHLKKYIIDKTNTKFKSRISEIL